MDGLSAEGEEGVFNRMVETLERLGFRYSSNFMDDDRPYILDEESKLGPVVELPVEWMLDDWPQFELQKRSTAFGGLNLKVYMRWADMQP